MVGAHEPVDLIGVAGEDDDGVAAVVLGEDQQGVDRLPGALVPREMVRLVDEDDAAGADRKRHV